MLNTNLDRDTIALCVSLCERGVNPEALAVSRHLLKRIFNILIVATTGGD